jgi:natural product precursor
MKKLKKLSFNNNFTVLSEAGMKAIMGGVENTCTVNASSPCSNHTCTDSNGIPVSYLTCRPMNGGGCYCAG